MKITPGAIAVFPGTWQQYKYLAEELGDRSATKIKFNSQQIILMNPLPEHGRKANLLADIAKILLIKQKKKFEAFTPITLELPDYSGIEPDYCFYIDNLPFLNNLDRIDWSTSPPPDLAIEIDVTSYTNINDYVPYCIPEVWIQKKSGLFIYLFDGQSYQQSSSQIFPDQDIAALIDRFETSSDAIAYLLQQ
ncbi:MAG: Uma2 family endonuclease [Waterburya sp.]